MTRIERSNRERLPAPTPANERRSDHPDSSGESTVPSVRARSESAAARLGAGTAVPTRASGSLSAARPTTGGNAAPCPTRGYRATAAG